MPFIAPVKKTARTIAPRPTIEESSSTAEHTVVVSAESSFKKTKTTPKTMNSRWRCEICNLSMHARAHLEIHNRIHTGEKPYACQVCSKRFRRTHDLTLHGLTHTGIKPFECSYCCERFNHKSNVRRHIKRYHALLDNLKHVCAICNEEFCKKKALEEHKQVKHEGVKHIFCDICKKTFERSYDLEVHLRVHAGEKPFVCEICCKGFRQKSIYNRHMKSHN